MPRDMPPITPETLLMAYASGVFPMAEGRDDPEIFWVDPKQRGVLPLDGFRMSRSLSKTVGQSPFVVTLNEDFGGVLAGCADREETWINAEIAALYLELHRSGFAHSLEVWADHGQRLVGGVYGVTLGSAFFGESMFSRARDASKIALAYMVTLLRQQGFTLFDTQFLTDHLASLGGAEISRAQYHAQLTHALGRTADLEGPMPQSLAVRQLRTQTS
ncbi:leucyl/phenylalanyl-tRNA--protein transferase [Jannaschia donghaensis]|uniref:Leucyl/phenylalanyl-tRNA--protein transferase n=1 Tax=Jannaschia donghaensis TaxID=420998 RepID=A0A0M6YI56_9RHOB|nr:leucyl/phenylalanyl-tRNA--protein transferase [Jannaschia donghaensis]CTQ48736.1 Leucyl/phenylalanyl-tRNA--protein transferase [Jannaschia donghaensis]